MSLISFYILFFSPLSARDASTCWSQQGGVVVVVVVVSSVSGSPAQIKSECRGNPAPPKEEKNLWICLELSFNLYFNVLLSNT